MRIIKRKLFWAEIRKKGNTITPTYFFDFDMLNELGFSEDEMYSFLEEIKIYAEKEMMERHECSNKKSLELKHP